MKNILFALLIGAFANSAGADSLIIDQNLSTKSLSNLHESGVELTINDAEVGSLTTDPIARDSSPSTMDLESMNIRPRRGSYYKWGKARNGYGYCYEYTRDGRVLNGGKPVGNYNCERRNPSVYNWGRARNGYGYCYQYTPYGVAMNEGRPVSNFQCERYNPSYYSWGRGRDGNTYCYQYTGNGIPMNEGKPVSNYYCK